MLQFLNSLLLLISKFFITPASAFLSSVILDQLEVIPSIQLNFSQCLVKIPSVLVSSVYWLVALLHQPLFDKYTPASVIRCLSLPSRDKTKQTNANGDGISLTSPSMGLWFRMKCQILALLTFLRTSVTVLYINVFVILISIGYQTRSVQGSYRHFGTNQHNV